MKANLMISLVKEKLRADIRLLIVARRADIMVSLAYRYKQCCKGNRNL